MTACKIDKHLGARITLAREENGIELVELASAMGVSSRELAEIEDGRIRVRASILARSAVNLNRSIGWFYDGLPGQALFDRGSK